MVVLWPRWSEAMARSARRHNHLSLENSRLKRLRHIHPLTPERQVALIRTARAARRAAQPRRCCPVEPTLRDQMLALLPNLRAFAVSLTNDPVRADDLVQDTILRAWAKIDRFERGTNLGAWLFTILHNSFRSDHRKRKHEVEDPEGVHVGRLKVQPEQEFALDLDDLRRGLVRLPSEQREAVILVGAEGMSYEAAAAICGVAVGTIKSRVNRARNQLMVLLQMEDRHDIGPDRVMQAALQGSAGMYL
jgi:RNA polymerase sigma-70 factor, ECF subfamily